MAESNSDAPTVRIKPVHNVFESADIANNDGRNYITLPLASTKFRQATPKQRGR